MNKYLFLFVLVVALVIVGSIAAYPLSQAQANNINARNAALSRIAEAEAREAEANAEATINERRALSPWLSAGYQLVVSVGLMALVVTTTAALTTGGSFAHATVSRNQRLAKMPVTRQIAPGAYVFQGEDGRNWLLDAYTGRQCLLANAQDVEMVRAGIMQQQLRLAELGKASAQIAKNSKSARPVDWLFSTALAERVGAAEIVDSEQVS